MKEVPTRAARGGSRLERRLAAAIAGDVHFDRWTRGRYATDASIYQVEPIGVVCPRRPADLGAIVEIAREEGASIVPRGAGTSQAGQAIGPGLVVDTGRYLHRILDVDVTAARARVQPGIVLDRLNRALRPHGLWFPIDVATASRATLGGMTGNNSAGARSLRYGLTVDQVRGVRLVTDDGHTRRFGSDTGTDDDIVRDLRQRIGTIRTREADELARRIPHVLRHVAGYNLHRLTAELPDLTPLLVGSEGTLGLFAELDLTLHPLPAHRALGVAHFPTLHAATETTQHIVTLEPSAVELVDRRVLTLAREHPTFGPLVDDFVRGDPGAILLVEFAGDSAGVLTASLNRLDDLMGSLGYPGATVRATDPERQERIWAVRRAGLNLVMSVAGDAKPVSFIEDCAVPLEHLAEYTDRVTEVFARHHTTGTWYAHASVGVLHVRPILDLKTADGATALRAIAEEVHEIVRSFGGSHSGEHGDGIVRSEFIAPMLGPRLATAFREIKQLFDPSGTFNPGRIVDPPRMDDRALFRAPPGYRALPLAPELDWTATGGFLSAVEMCNNNGACRKLDAGVMCPSWRATRNERDSTRGRANTLRLALTGQLGPAALTSQAMYETMELCVGCKACRRECPTGVDMARMKLEVLARYREEHGVALGTRLVAALPRYAPWVSRVAPLANLRNRSTLLARAGERWLDLAADRTLPEWHRHPFRARGPWGPEDGPQVVLLVDTFNRWFEPDNVHAALDLLTRLGYRVTTPRPAAGGHPLCCGRTWLSEGLLDQARRETRRTLEALTPYVERGVPVLGLEPSCLLTLRDEFVTLHGDAARPLARGAYLIDEFLAARLADGQLDWPATLTASGAAIVHGHCHQRAFGAADATLRILERGGVDAEPVDAGCCGMAGSFGYETRHADVSRTMAELGVAPAVRRAAPGQTVVANGFSCRHQIRDLTGRDAVHVVRVLGRP